MSIKRFAKVLAVSAFVVGSGIQDASACGDFFDSPSWSDPQVLRQFISPAAATQSRYSSRLTPAERAKFAGNAATVAEAARPAVGRRLLAEQKLIEKSKFGEALDSVAQAEAVDTPTPYETYAIATLRAAAFDGVGDSLGAAKAYEVVLDSGRLPADQQLQVAASVAATYFRAKDYPRAVRRVRRYQQDGGTDAEVLALVPKAYYLAGHFRNAAHESSVLIAAARAAGQEPSEELLKLRSSSLALQKNKDGTDRVQQTAVSYTPKS